MVDRARRTQRLRAQRRRPADRRPRPRPRASSPAGGHLLRDRGPGPGPAGAPARPRRQALPALRPPLLVRAGVRRPPRPLQLPELRRRPPRARPRGDGDRAPRDDAGRGRACGRPRARRSSSSPSPASTTSTTRSPRSRRRCGSASRSSARSGALASVQAAFGRVETIEVAGTPVSILLIKNPAGANEVLRTLRLEAAPGTRRRPRPLDRAQRPDRRRPRRLLGLGRRLRADRGGRPPDRLRRAPGRRRSPCGSSTPGVDPAAIDDRALDRALARPRRRGGRRPAVRAADLHRADRASPAARRARAGAGVLAMSAPAARLGGRLARRRVRRLRRRPAGLGGARRRGRPGRCSSSARGPGGCRCDLARAGFDVVAVDSASELIDELAHARRGGRARGRGRLRRRPPSSSSVASSRPIIAPMQLMHLLGGAGGRAAVLTRGARPPAPRRGLRRRAARRRDRRRRRGRLELLPDVRELDGWVCSSLPLEVAVGRWRDRGPPAAPARQPRAAS